MAKAPLKREEFLVISPRFMFYVSDLFIHQLTVLTPLCGRSIVFFAKSKDT